MAEALNKFLGEWSNIVLFIFSMFGLLVAITRIIGFVRSRMLDIVEEAVRMALIDQRQNYQAEAIDELLKVIRSQQDDIRTYSKAKEDDAINSAKCLMILQSKNQPAPKPEENPELNGDKLTPSPE